MTSHAEKRVLVTGAGRGIGYAIAKAHAEAGATVLCVDSDVGLAAAAAQSLSGPEGRGGAFAYAGDVADYDAVMAIVADAERQCGPVDILVNNAGISPKNDGRKSDIWAMSAEEWRRVVDVNLTGAFNFCRAVSGGMRQRRFGRIVNISSVAGQTYCDIVGVHYAATKAGLIGLTKHLAGELGAYGITVNAVAPGRIETDLIRGVASDINEAIRLATPMCRLGLSSEVADVVLFFTSEAASFVTGQVCDVSGGWLMT